MQTPPQNLTLSAPASDEALDLLADGLAREGWTFPGVTAALPEAEAFAARWMEATGIRVRRRMALAIHRLTRVRPPPTVPGTMRPAIEADRDLLLDWVGAFETEAHEDAERARTARVVDGRLSDGPGAGFVLWEIEGAAVSLAGFAGPTPNGIRVGPVYTPPEHRRRGYASALVAELSAELLARGRRFCFLFTDLANPTSNHVYARIGYEHVCDSADLAFERADVA
jgi:predicted GNAT family acetyltransferase